MELNRHSRAAAFNAILHDRAAAEVFFTGIVGIVFSHVETPGGVFVQDALTSHMAVVI